MWLVKLEKFFNEGIKSSLRQQGKLYAISVVHSSDAPLLVVALLFKFLYILGQF